MSSQQWYLYIEGESIGPLTTEVVKLFLQQHRLHFIDYIWTSSLTKWHRIIDLDEFAALLPPYPDSPIPEKSTNITAPPLSLEKEKIKKQKPAKIVEEKRSGKSWPKARRCVRVPCKGQAQLADHGSFPVTNISEGGIFLQAKEVLPVGTEVKFQLELSTLSKKMEMTGVVIRHSNAAEESGFVIEFTRLNPAHKRILAEFIARHGR